MVESKSFHWSSYPTHLKVTIRILCNLKGIINLGLFYFSSDYFSLVGYCDSDYGGDFDDRKSTFDFVNFFFGWLCYFLEFKKNNQLLLSPCEVEYIATNHVCIMLFRWGYCWRNSIFHKLKSQWFMSITNIRKHLQRIQCIMIGAST